MAKKELTITPLGERVLVRVEDTSKEQTTAGGIIIPQTAQEDRGAKRGVVIAVGKGVYKDGEYIPMVVKKGDTVLFSWGEELIVDGENYTIVGESNILAVIK